VPGRFTDEDLRFLGGFANQASLGMENALLYERIEREAALRQNLLRFFPETIAQRLMSDQHAALEPVEGTVTALFCDLTDFVGLGDGLPPRALFEVLQEYLQAISEVVFEYEGTLEKYIGDAVMAVWGAPYARPDDALRAVQAAAAMQRAMVDVNRRVARFDRELTVHVGINTGPSVAGNIGSRRYLQYAAIGDATSLAARVCAKASANQILITEATRLALSRSAPPLEGPFPFIPKGKTEPITTWLVPWRSMVPP
jgi:adenylate cyclase